MRRKDYHMLSKALGHAVTLFINQSTDSNDIKTCKRFILILNHHLFEELAKDNPNFLPDKFKDLLIKEGIPTE